jgi:hypothetical protein
VRPLLPRQRETLLSVRRFGDDVAFLFEVVADQISDVRFVFDHEY